MQLLFLVHEFPPFGGGGGIAAANIARELVRRGHGVSVITAGDAQVTTIEDFEGVRVIRGPGSRRGPLENRVLTSMLQYLWHAPRLAQQEIVRRRPCVIHAFFTIPAGLVGVRLGKRYGLPVITALRGSDVPGYNTGQWKWPMRLVAPLVRHVWRRSAAAVSLSEGLRRIALAVDPSLPSPVITNGIDTELFRPPVAPRDHTGPLRLLTVSRLVAWKGIQDLLSALGSFTADERKHYELTIVGEGSHRGALQSQAAALGLERVRFVGAVPQVELPRYYGAAELFVLPSLTESFGQVFGEAMACGLPIIGTQVGGIPEVVRHDRDGILVPAGDPAAVAAALKAMSARRHDFDAIGAAAREHTVRSFSWPAVASAYLDLYASLSRPAAACA